MPPQGDPTNAKQLIVGRIQQANNILVAVGNGPSIDSLSAALALTLVLNKLDKHATALFSGQVPAVMQFLNPEKTFEDNVDSLRDFIISLDKSKADRLRYKLEKDVVRIFITPYRTTITQNDLQFSQGDFNIDLVIALGVEKREDLDKAITAHGRILHDATIVTINSNGQQSSLGAVDWHDVNSSSLCEMLVSLTEALQKPGLLDAQIANALLTGIVAATDRFSNQHTTPRVMTMSAQLMAAGANQQLVSVNMQKTDLPTPPKLDEEPGSETTADGELDIKHAPGEDKPDKNNGKKSSGEPEPNEGEPDADLSPEALAKGEAELDKTLPKPAATLDVDESLNDLKAQLEEVAEEGSKTEPEKQATDEPEPTPESQVERKFVSEEPTAAAGGSVNQGGGPLETKDDKSANSWRGHRLEPPTLGGSLSSTSEEALEDKQRVEEAERNHKLLSHGGQTDEEPAIPPMPAGLTEPETPPTIDPLPEPSAEQLTPDSMAQDALKDAHSAIDSQEFSPAGNPRQDLGTQPLSPQPYIPIEPTIPQKPDEPKSVIPPTDANGLPIIPPMPLLPTEDPGSPSNLPPMPPPLPPLPGEPQSGEPPVAPPPTSDPNQPQGDPGQFKIPG